MEGTPTYVVLPEELWTPEMYEMKRKGGSPVFPLRKALYGHKNSGEYWQAFCGKQCKEAGFLPISDNWPCAYYSDKGQLLIVYVDDMKLAGPLELMAETWERLGKGIVLEQPKGNLGDSMTFLGCEQTLVEKTIKGKPVRGVKRDVSHSIAMRC